jgi:hypothetical protein
MMAAQKPPSPQQEKLAKGKKGAAAATEVGIFHPEHPYRDAFVKTAFSVGAALLFGLGVWHFKGADSGLEYYSGCVCACVRVGGGGSWCRCPTVGEWDR